MHDYHNMRFAVRSHQRVFPQALILPRPLPMPAEIGYSLRRGRWDLQTACRVCKHTVVFLVPFRKDRASMNGTPHPNRILILLQILAENVSLHLRVNMIFVFTFDNLQGPLFTFEVGIVFTFVVEGICTIGGDCS